MPRPTPITIMPIDNYNPSRFNSINVPMTVHSDHTSPRCRLAPLPTLSALLMSTGHSPFPVGSRSKGLSKSHASNGSRGMYSGSSRQASGFNNLFPGILCGVESEQVAVPSVFQQIGGNGGKGQGWLVMRVPLARRNPSPFSSLDGNTVKYLLSTSSLSLAG